MESAMMQMALRMLRGAARRGRRFYRDEKGSIIGFLAILPILIGVAAVGIETGQLYRVKRQMQGAADAAAMAAAIDKAAGKSTDVVLATARYEAFRNGFSNGVNNVTVTAAAPTSGSHMSMPGAIKVEITKQVKFSLGAFFVNRAGGTNNPFNIKSTAVAAMGTYSQSSSSGADGCLLAMTKNAEQGINFTGFSSFTADCTIAANSSATGTGSNAAVNMSNFSSATVKQIWARGAVTVTGNVTYTDPNGGPAPNQSTYISDPYATIGPVNLPATTICDETNYSKGNTSTVTVTMNPSGSKVFCGGLTVRSASTVNFSPGVYYIAGGDLYLSSVSTVSCPTCTPDNGIAFVLTQIGTDTADAGIGGVMITSDSTITFNAGKSNNGRFNGILFYQDPRATTGTMSSTSKIFTVSSLSNATLSGAIYFPNNRIDISSISNFGGSPTTGCTIWLGRYLKFQSFSRTYKGGCANYGTTAPTITVTSTYTKARVLE
jgi:Flp pilus assembly protein TadG